MDLHYSQTNCNSNHPSNSFITLWIYTILKPNGAQVARRDSFITLWIYTILKRDFGLYLLYGSFITLWIYTILKLIDLLENLDKVLLPYGFTLFSNDEVYTIITGGFYYLMDLHYSQT